jgi:hypothetical protein
MTVRIVTAYINLDQRDKLVIKTKKAKANSDGLINYLIPLVRDSLP